MALKKKPTLDKDPRFLELFQKELERTGRLKQVEGIRMGTLDKRDRVARAATSYEFLNEQVAAERRLRIERPASNRPRPTRTRGANRGRPHR